MAACECLEHKWIIDLANKKEMSRQNGVAISEICNEITSKIVDEHKSLSLSLPSAPPSLPPKPNFLLRNSTKPFNEKSTLNGLKDEKVGVKQQQQQHQEKQHTDYMNKENINLSKILNRPPGVVVNGKGISLNAMNNNGINGANNDSTGHNDNNDTTNNGSTIVTDDHRPLPILPSLPSSSIESDNIKATTKYEKTLFPDAPTTPKVSRKSTTDIATPACVTLVKQFQLNCHKTSITGSGEISSNSINGDTNDGSSNGIATPSSSSSVNLLSLDAYTHHSHINGNRTIHHFNHHSKLHRLSANSLNDTSSSVSPCICNKTASSCCCSTTTLYRENKSMQVVENSILC